MSLTDDFILEAAKPATGLINAFLGPKIEKIKLWANEKELVGQLDQNNLSVVMSEYLTSLSHRVSELTTLSFPMLKLNINDAYEPLELELLHHGSGNDIDFEVTTFINGSDKCFMIVDPAGMGKSTFSKFLVTQLLFKSERIPILYELRKVDISVDIIENLARELDFPGNPFSRELFYRLLKLGKFIVILDGFDEAPLEHQSELANQIKELSIKGCENKVILTSRPQDTLPDMVSSISLKFKKFELSQAIALLKRYDLVSSLDIGKHLIDEIDSVPSKLMGTPLLVSLLYRTFGINKSIANRVSTFYDEIYQALYKGHDLINKNSFGREKKSGLDFEDFRRLLRAFCYRMMVSRKTSFTNTSEIIEFIDDASVITSITPSSGLNYLDDLLVAVPLMQKEGNEYKFSHKTILEYFVAEYLVYNKNSSSLLKKIFESKLASSFETVFDFLDDISPSLFDAVITSHYANLAKNITITDDEHLNLINTLYFTRTFKVGIWNCSKYSRQMKDGYRTLDVPQEYLSNSEHMKYMSTTWRESVYEKESYFVAITFTDLSHNLHPKAWEKISTKSNSSVIWKNSEIDINELKEIVGFNSWIEIDIGNIDLLREMTTMNQLIKHVIVSRRLGAQTELRLVSPSKAINILSKISEEEEMEKELESFL